jgi:nucleoside phosphorylase
MSSGSAGWVSAGSAASRRAAMPGHRDSGCSTAELYSHLLPPERDGDGLVGDPPRARKRHLDVWRSGIVNRDGEWMASWPVLELGSVQADVVILTVLPEEYGAALSCLSDVAALRGTDEDPNTYAWQLGTIGSSLYGAPFTVAVGKGTQTTSYGALAAKRAIQLFSPRYIVFVGIGGGLDRDGQRHGDVVVSSVVAGYEYGKIDSDGFCPRGDFTYRCDEGLVRAADALISGDATWWSHADNPERPPRARTGLIASGDKVVDDPDDGFFAAVRKLWPKVLAVEMEGAGVGAAALEAQAEGKVVGFLLVRGISDLPHAKVPGEVGSTLERDHWKKTASCNAARFLAHLVCNGWPVPPHRTVPAALQSQPAMVLEIRPGTSTSPAPRRTLAQLLFALVVTETYSGRTQLLDGVKVHMKRSQELQLLDLQMIVSQLREKTQSDGRPCLAVVIDNAMVFAEGTDVYDALRAERAALGV